MTVSRETVALLLRSRGLDEAAAQRLTTLLEALEAEPNPPTTVADAARALTVHIADSLAGLDVPALAHASAIADLGAGAGFPGLALAAVRPRVRVDLIESGRRKCELIERLAAAAELGNARAIAARAEDWARGQGRGVYSAATARALAPLPVILEYAAPLLREGGSLIAYKGAREPDEEQAGLRAASELGLECEQVLVVVPYEGSRPRHLFHYVKRAETPERFPRRSGSARKRPLG